MQPVSRATIAAVVAGGLGLLFLVMGISANNREAQLRNAFNAQLENNKTSLDRSWKTIDQQAQVTLTERDSFRKTYVEIMTASKGVAGEGKLAAFFQQAGIPISNELFRNLMTTIESQREAFFRDQQHLLKLKQEHDNLRTTFPSKLFVGAAPELQVQLVTSEKTEEIFSTGREDKIHVFGEAPPKVD